MTPEDYKRRLLDAVSKYVLGGPREFVDGGVEIVVEQIRRSRDWKIHPDGGFVCSWPEEWGVGETRWDGALKITEEGTLRASIDQIVINCTIKEGA